MRRANSASFYKTLGGGHVRCPSGRNQTRLLQMYYGYYSLTCPSAGCFGSILVRCLLEIFKEMSTWFFWWSCISLVSDKAQRIDGFLRWLYYDTNNAQKSKVPGKQMLQVFTYLMHSISEDLMHSSSKNLMQWFNCIISDNFSTISIHPCTWIQARLQHFGSLSSIQSNPIHSFIGGIA